MSIGARALFANYAALQTVGNNIANANTPGYSRQQVEFATTKGQYTGAGFFGKGVDVANIVRAHDAFLAKEASLTKSLSAFDQTRRGKLADLENVFPPGERGLGYSAGQFLNAMVDVASNPSDPSARQVVLSRAKELASRFAASGERLDTIQASVTSDLTNSIGTVNSLAKQIAKVNDQIARTQGGGKAPNDLLDQRDQLIAQISQFVQISTIPADDGSVAVFLGGGQRLVLGSEAQALVTLADSFDASRTRLGITEANGTRALDSALLGSGSIGALLTFQDVDLQDARNMVGQMAAALSDQVNRRQALGLDLQNSPRSGVPIFRVGGPVALGASSNTPGTSLGLSIADARQLQASAYELRTDPAGSAGIYQLTRLSDGRVFLVQDDPGGNGLVNTDPNHLNQQIDGLKITLGAVPMGSTDRFMLQPVTRSANTMARVLDDPNGIAAAAPLTATMGSSNKGTATIAALSAVSSTIDPSTGKPFPTLRGAINFTDDLGNYTWNLYDATNTLMATGSGTWTAGTPILSSTWLPAPATPSGYEFSLNLNGVPRSGDVINIDSTKFPGSNNGNAKAFVAMQTTPIVGRVMQPGGALSGGSSITDAYANSMSNVGVRVQGAKAAADISASAATDAETARSSQAGVNLDEEASRLMQYQQSYQAAAKVLQAAQNIFDTLLRTMA